MKKDIITSDMKIYNIVKKYPELMDVLIDASPKFIKLKNIFVFNTMAKMTDVKDAAKIGGLKAEDLLLTLNKAIGKEQEYLAVKDLLQNDGEPEVEESRNYGWESKKEIFKVLDVRELGDDAFEAITKFAEDVTSGEGICIIQKFEPTPLYKAMDRRGFEHITEKVSEEEYRAFFYKK